MVCSVIRMEISDGGSMTPTLQPLPVGIQDFAQLREGGFLYVDKTELVHRLVTTSKAVFLSRPRRFGKSLLCSVFANLYEGRKDLFAGLWIEGQWNWDKKHPVVRISFETGLFLREGELRESLARQVRAIGKVHGVDVAEPASLGALLAALRGNVDKPVVLIDGYDLPIQRCQEEISNLGKTRSGSILRALRDNVQFLEEFLSALVAEDLEFLFVTGRMRADLQALGGLMDISRDAAYATICGLTVQDIVQSLSARLAATCARTGRGIEGTLEGLVSRHGGFRFFAGAQSVFSPAELFCALSGDDYSPGWAMGGNPGYLLNALRESGGDLPDLLASRVLPDDYSLLSPLAPELVSLHVQSGTLVPTVSGDGLDFPNSDVRVDFLIHYLKHNHAVRMQDGYAHSWMLRALRDGDIDQFFKTYLRVLNDPWRMAKAPQDVVHNGAGLLYAYCIFFAVPTSDVIVRLFKEAGQRDIVVIDLPEICYLFEFKRDTDTAEALAQMAVKEYENQWEGRLLADGIEKPVRKVAVTFGTAERNIVKWEIA